MLSRLIILLAAAQLLADSTRAESAPRLDVDAEPAVVYIKPSPVGRKLIRLPALEFQLNIRADCAIDTETRSISISVADTRKTVSGDDVTGLAEAPVLFSVPARQVSPVAVHGFCPPADEPGRSKEVLIKGAVTTHLSLRCASEDGDSITYTSRALDVMLLCDDSDESQGEPASETAR